MQSVDAAYGSMLYLAENLPSLHDAPDLAWLAGRFEFLGEKALGAALTVLALSDEQEGYRAAEAASPRPATTRDLWRALDIDGLPDNHTVATRIAEAEVRARSIVVPVEELFRGQQAMAGADTAILAAITHNQEQLGAGIFLAEGTAENQRLANVLTAHAAVAIHQLRERERARRLHSVDPRLWVPDEHFLLVQLRREVTRARRYQRELGVALIRMENEAGIRGRFGDFFTDHLLRLAGSQLLAQVRDSDILGAMGGAYAVIHTETGREGTQISGGRLAEGLAHMVVQRFPEVGSVGFSVRVAAFPATASSTDEMLAQLVPEAADQDAAAA
jgi:diguanylate cyclase (GGDEF)-like protein